MAVTPDEIAALLGLNVDLISKSRPFAATLIQIAHSVSSNVEAFNLFRKNADLMRNFSVSQAYKLTQFWSRLGYYLAELPRYVQTPQAFTILRQRMPRFDVRENDYRYDVYVTIYFPEGGSHEFGLSVDLPGLVSAQEAEEAAWEKVEGYIKKDKYDFENMTMYEFFRPSFKITGVNQISPASV